MRGRPAALVTLGLLVALGAVALAASGESPVGTPGTRRPSEQVLDVVLSLFLVLMGCSALFLLYVFFMRKDIMREAARRRRERSRGGRIASVLVAFAFFALLAIWFSQGDGPRTIRIPGLGDPRSAEELLGLEERKRYQPEFAWVPVLLVFGLALAASAAVAVSARRRSRARGELDGLTGALVEAVEDSLDDLRAERDPRRAVIASYARLESVLAAYGFARRPSEAPVEYLERMLAHADVSPPSARALTALFERARFSQHEVRAEMKDEAIAALVNVREELRAAALRAEQERLAALEAARERAAAG